MKLLNTIKEFLAYKQSIDIGQRIDTLGNNEKEKLSAFDSDIIEKLYDRTLDKLSSEMLKGELSADYVNGAKFSLLTFKKHFRNYNK